MTNIKRIIFLEALLNYYDVRKTKHDITIYVSNNYEYIGTSVEYLLISFLKSLSESLTNTQCPINDLFLYSSTSDPNDFHFIL